MTPTLIPSPDGATFATELRHKGRVATITPTGPTFLLTLGASPSTPYTTERGAHLAAHRYLRGSR